MRASLAKKHANTKRYSFTPLFEVPSVQAAHYNFKGCLNVKRLIRLMS